MFKKIDPNPQLDIFTAPSMQLGSRASKKYSDPNAWHNQFYSTWQRRLTRRYSNLCSLKARRAAAQMPPSAYSWLCQSWKRIPPRPFTAQELHHRPPRRHGFARHDSWQLARLYRSGNLPQWVAADGGALKSLNHKSIGFNCLRSRFHCSTK